MASLQRRHLSQVSDDIGEVGFFQSGIIIVGHRRLERPPVACNSLGDGASDFLIGPGPDAGGRVRGDVGGGAAWHSLRRPFTPRENPAAPAQSIIEIRNPPRPRAEALQPIAAPYPIPPAPTPTANHALSHSA